MSETSSEEKEQREGGIVGGIEDFPRVQHDLLSLLLEPGPHGKEEKEGKKEKKKKKANVPSIIRVLTNVMCFDGSCQIISLFIMSKRMKEA